jgi:hypothetical protein
MMDRYKHDIISAGRDYNRVHQAICSGFFRNSSAITFDDLSSVISGQLSRFFVLQWSTDIETTRNNFRNTWLPFPTVRAETPTLQVSEPSNQSVNPSQNVLVRPPLPLA